MKQALALATILGALVALPAPAVAGQDQRVRKAAHLMSDAEWQRFVDAVSELKRDGTYDDFVRIHLNLYRCTPGQPEVQPMMLAHNGPMFLPWHREYLLRFEDALRRAGGQEITIPYWDFTSAQSTRILFTGKTPRMGGNGDPEQGHAVTDGPFRKGAWELEVHPKGIEMEGSATPYLTRNFGTVPGVTTPPTQEAVDFAFSAAGYDAAPYHSASDPAASFRNAVEGFWRNGPIGRFAEPGPNRAQCGPDGWLAVGNCGCNIHNGAHVWVAGSLARAHRDGEPAGFKVFGTMGLNTSPNDPSFWLLHSNIDRLWAEWQDAHPDRSGHPTRAQAGAPNGHDSEMSPFAGRTPDDVRHVREQLGYRYDTQSGRSRAALCYLRTERR